MFLKKSTLPLLSQILGTNIYGFYLFLLNALSSANHQISSLPKILNYYLDTHFPNSTDIK